MTDNAKKFLEETSEDELQAVAGGANYNPKVNGLNADQEDSANYNPKVNGLNADQEDSANYNPKITGLK